MPDMRQATCTRTSNDRENINHSLHRVSRAIGIVASREPHGAGAAHDGAAHARTTHPRRELSLLFRQARFRQSHDRGWGRLEA